MKFPQQFKTYQVWLLIIMLSSAIFVESFIPYWYAGQHTPQGMHFLGQIAYTLDQNMYFSFTSQARDGHFILNNKLTGIPNPPVFVNLEFWLAGFIQHISGISENAAYQVWRYLGVLLLTTGVYAMAVAVLPTARKVLMAMLLLLFSGGFGFIFALLDLFHIIGGNTTQLGIIDFRYGLLPFQQMTTNPHFSFPHGLILIAYACFLLGERRNKIAYYALSGLVFTVIGLVRPYDIIPPVIIFPLFILITHRPFRFDLRLFAIKLLPLLLIIPVFLYNVWLFKFNDIFKYWAQQGLNAGSMPSAIWHYLGFGIAGMLAVVRLSQLRAHPLDKFGKFLLVWFGVTFAFIQLGKIVPAIGWSPQIGVYLMVPLALLGCSIRSVSWSRSIYYTGLAVVVACVALSNITTVLYFTKNFKGDKTQFYYAQQSEVDAWMWLNDHVAEGAVVLAGNDASLHIAKYSKCRVVAAHYSVTPRFQEMSGLVAGIYVSSHLGYEQKPQLQQMNVDYVYIGPLEKRPKNIRVDSSDYLTPVFANAAVAIYKVNRTL